MELNSFGSDTSKRFRPEEHLKGRNEIREVFSKGKRTSCQGVKLFALKNSLLRNRICFTCARGFKTAVERNRAKRLGREAYRNLSSRLIRGYDLILLTYPEDKASDGRPVSKKHPTCIMRKKQLEYLCTRAGLLC